MEGGEKLFTAFEAEIPGQRIYSNEITGLKLPVVV